MVYKDIKENPVEMDDLGVPPFQETSIWDYMEMGQNQLIYHVTGGITILANQQF